MKSLSARMYNEHPKNARREKISLELSDKQRHSLTMCSTFELIMRKNSNLNKFCAIWFIAQNAENKD